MGLSVQDLELSTLFRTPLFQSDPAPSPLKEELLCEYFETAHFQGLWPLPSGRGAQPRELSHEIATASSSKGPSRQAFPRATNPWKTY